MEEKTSGQRGHWTASADRLLGAMIGLVRASDSGGIPEQVPPLLAEGLWALRTAPGDEHLLTELAGRVRAEKDRLVPDCAVCPHPCGHNADYLISELWGEGRRSVRALKTAILLLLEELAGSFRQSFAGEERNGAEEELLCRALFALGEDWDGELLLPLLLELGNRVADGRGSIQS